MIDADVTIRTAEASDVDRLTDLLIELFFIETDFVINGEKHARGISIVISSSDKSVMFVAEYEGRIIGMVSGQIVISTAIGAPSLLLEDMCVTSAYRRTGIGTALMQRLADWAREKGAQRFQLVTDKDNHPAIMFYRKHGFKPSRMTAMYKTL
jgi:ribosomal protein S18 acetylase RimI-like enzyme